LSKFTGQNIITTLETVLSRLQGAQLVVLCFAVAWFCGVSKTHAFSIYLFMFLTDRKKK